MKILTENDQEELKILQCPSEPVTVDDMKCLNPVIKEMREFLESTRGLGLAAPQIGILRQFFLVKEQFRNIYRVICNPEIIWHSDILIYNAEGCFSVPGISVSVPRYNSIRVRYQTLNDLYSGTTTEKTLFDQESRVFQHEIGHLNGILISKFINTASSNTTQRQLND